MKTWSHPNNKFYLYLDLFSVLSSWVKKFNVGYSLCLGQLSSALYKIITLLIINHNYSLWYGYLNKKFGTCFTVKIMSSFFVQMDTPDRE